MRSDPYELLLTAASRDQSWAAPVDLDEDRQAAAILQRVFAGAVVVPMERRGRRGRRLAVGTAVVAVLAAGSAVAATSWTRRTPSTVRALACWNHAPLGDDGVILATRFQREDPVVTCQRMWAQPQYETNHVTGDLVTCVADYGTAVVIPGADETACDTAGLDRFDGHIAPDVYAIEDVEDETANLLTNGDCMDPTDATHTVRDILDRHGLKNWTITVSNDPTIPGDTCSTFAFDEPTTTATILQVPKADL